MSLYHALFGINKGAPFLLAILDIDQGGKWVSGRFRDCFLNEDGTHILLYTRNGGGNREHYNDEHAEGEECFCTGCIITYHLPKHPYYVGDEDDDFDCTYATVTFRVPEKYVELTKSIATGEKPESVHEKFSKVYKEMATMTPEQMEKDVRFKPIMDMMKKIGESFDKGESGKIIEI